MDVINVKNSSLKNTTKTFVNCYNNTRAVLPVTAIVQIELVQRQLSANSLPQSCRAPFVVGATQKLFAYLLHQILAKDLRFLVRLDLVKALLSAPVRLFVIARLVKSPPFLRRQQQLLLLLL